MEVLRLFYWRLLEGDPLFILALSLPLVLFVLVPALLASQLRRNASFNVDSLGLQVLAAVSTAWLIGTAMVYPLFSSYVDHVESAIASSSWVAFQGRAPLYHALDATTRHSLLYGPMVYLIHSVSFSLFGAGIAASKVMGVVFCLASILMVFQAIKGLCDGSTALILTGLMSLGFLGFQNMAYWGRPDAFLIVCVALGILALNSNSPMQKAVAIGFGCGLAIGLKVHGILYMIPVLAVYLAGRPGLRQILLTCALAFIVSTAPFLLPQVSFLDYVSTLRAAARHGIDLRVLTSNMIMLVPILAPLIAIRLLRAGNGSSSGSRVFEIGLLAAALMVALFAAKPGSGPHHYLPIFPAVAFACGLALQRSSPSEAGGWAAQGYRLAGGIAFIVAALALVPKAVISQQQVVSTFGLHAPLRAASRDVRSVLAENVGRTVAMGYSSHAGYQFAGLSPLIVFDGHPYFIEAVSFMDYDAAGVRVPGSTIEALRRCDIAVWLIPKEGVPFSMANYYPTNRNIFGDEFPKAFFETYEKSSATRFFDVWACRRDR